MICFKIDRCFGVDLPEGAPVSLKEKAYTLAFMTRDFVGSPNDLFS
jgi:hypothetical protein